MIDGEGVTAVIRSV